jgi:hypothetical protein
MVTKELIVKLRNPHPKQVEFITSPAKRKIIRAGRRGGKTVGIAILAIKSFLAGKRALYAAPTSEQTDRFWFEVNKALSEIVDAKLYHKNEIERYIEKPGTENRIKAKTAWNANTLRGDFADLLILDEWQLTAEDAWEEVGAPMLLDNNGDAVFVYTPPSLSSSGISRARDPRHASKMFKKAQEDKTGRWATFTFSSHDNPYISSDALNEITKDMTLDAYRKEILAQDDEIESSWLVYSNFNPQVCKIPRFPIPTNWLIYSGHDFGSSNPAALFFAQDPATGQFYAFREYLPGGNKSTPQHVEAFKEITLGYNVIKRVGGSHQEDGSRGDYTSHGWVITEPKINRVKEQIDRVKDMMTLNKVFVFEDLTNYLNEIANCLWKLDNENKPTNEIKDEARYHLASCARYILSDFRPETVTLSNIPRIKKSANRF